MERSNSLLFVVDFGKHWMGGVYYVRNLLATILLNQDISRSKIYILCPDEHKVVFKDFESHPNITLIARKKHFRKINAAIRKFLSFIYRDFPLDVIWHATRLSVTSIFPVTTFPFLIGSKRCVYWIPDFQHFKLPMAFTSTELKYRTSLYKAISNRPCRLLLSSRDSCSHYREIFPNAVATPVCIPFISDIESEIKELSHERELSILSGFGLADGNQAIPYIYIPNQFWTHKNHLIALSGYFEYCRRHPDSKLIIVCTGSTQDYRAKDYYLKVKELIKKSGFSQRVIVLEFIDRLSQISILKHCRILLQPSLFEGWGTGVQEAKRFAKSMILSDIPIHLEQGDDRAIFFDRNSPQDLADKIELALSFPPYDPPDTDKKVRYLELGMNYSISAGKLFLNLEMEH